jgi:hypothetical protein
MSPKTVTTAVILAALASVPAVADEAQRHRGGRQSGNRSGEAREAPAPPPSPDNRAVARNSAPQERDGRRQYQDRRPQYEAPRGYAVPRQNDSGRYADRRFDDRGFYGRRFGSPRLIRPTIVEVVPYRPYIYRPSWSIGVYYGAGGSYPYGYVPRGYYDPIPGRYYGGLRITGAPRDARVFADGYYVGIVDDFDGVFQHLNLESGPHHIEIDAYGFEPIAFDVDVRPGQTITFRADMYRPY